MDDALRHIAALESLARKFDFQKTQPWLIFEAEVPAPDGPLPLAMLVVVRQIGALACLLHSGMFTFSHTFLNGHGILESQQ